MSDKPRKGSKAYLVSEVRKLAAYHQAVYDFGFAIKLERGDATVGDINVAAYGSKAMQWLAPQLEAVLSGASAEEAIKAAKVTDDD